MKNKCFKARGMIALAFLLSIIATTYGDTKAEQATKVFHDIQAYFVSKSFDKMQIDSSLVVAPPFNDSVAIAIRVSFPFGFPNDDIAYFRAHLNNSYYDIKFDNNIPVAWTAPSVFYGLVPFNANLQELRIVPIGTKEMEEWSEYEISFSDYNKLDTMSYH